MAFSEKVQAEALVASGRSCCICHKFCGTKIALHHIKQKAYGGDDSFENCIPLCLDCHEDMGKADPNHVTGKHYTEKELRMHRDKWYEKCSGKANALVEASDEDINALFTGKTHGLDGSYTKVDMVDQNATQGKKTRIDMLNHAGGLTVIIDDEKYIAERVVDEHNKEIERLLRKI